MGSVSAREVGSHLLGHLRREPRPTVVHGQQDRAQPQPVVQLALDQVDGPDQLRHPLERVVLTLDRNQDLVGRHQCVQGEQTERRRAVDEDVVRGVLRQVGAERPEQPVLPRHHGHQLDLGAGQVDGGRQHGEIRAPRLSRPRGRRADRPRSAPRTSPGCRPNGRRRARSRRCPADRGRSPAPRVRRGRARSPGSPRWWSCRRRPSGWPRRRSGSPGERAGALAMFHVKHRRARPRGRGAAAPRPRRSGPVGDRWPA